MAIAFPNPSSTTFKPFGLSAQSKWLRAVSSNFQQSCLVIHENEFDELFHPSEPLHGVKSFLDAEYYLWNLKRTNNQLPKAIIVNRPFETAQIQYFAKFLQADENLSAIPFFYSNTYLNYSIITSKCFKSLVDDVLMVKGNSFRISADHLETIKLLKCHSGKVDSVIENEIVPTLNTFVDIEKLAKRLFDITFSLLLLILAFPIMLIAAIAIRIESKGGIFYVSERAGRGFKIFKFLKFRTMVLDADKKVKNFNELNQYSTSDLTPTFFKLRNDPRITKVGAFLRATSLDELPQLINVLLGDMSIVGNRPLPIYEAEGLTTNEYAERFMTYAGITGLWQIKKKEIPDMTSKQRIGFDISYARSQNFLNDIMIILKTPAALLQQPNT